MWAVGDRRGGGGGRRGGGREEGGVDFAFVCGVEFEAEDPGAVDVAGGWRDFVFEGHEEEVGEGGADESTVHPCVLLGG